MARKLQDSTLNTRAARDKLKTQQKRYYRCIDKGRHIAYYKGKSGGSWIARYLHNDGKYEEYTLGIADDKLDADGLEIFSYTQALAKADEWFKKQSLQSAGIKKMGPYTVKDAMRDYLLAYEQSGKTDLRGVTLRIKSTILPPLGHLLVERLTADQIRAWHSEIANTPPKVRTKKDHQQAYKAISNTDEDIRKRRATSNRHLTTLKAALNHAFQDGKVESDLQWRKVKKFAAVDIAKVSYLTTDEAVKLIAACDSEFKPLVLAALLTGCRYGEITRLVVGDYEPRTATLIIRKSKSRQSRFVSLNDEGVTFFNMMTKDLANEEFIFKKTDGSQWKKSEQQRPMELSRKLAGLSVSFHILRHSFATGLLGANVSIPIIARSIGNADSRITEKHYAHLIPSNVSNAIKTSLPKLGVFGELKEPIH